MDAQEKAVFDSMPTLTQRQDGLDEQVRDLIPFAIKLGMRDAADFLEVKRIMDHT